MIFTSVILYVQNIMDVVPAFLYYNGRWNSENNKFIDYKVEGIIIPKNCSYEELISIVAEKIKLDCVVNAYMFDIRFQAKEGHQAMKIEDDDGVRFYWAVMNMEKEVKAYPLCVSVPVIKPYWWG